MSKDPFDFIIVGSGVSGGRIAFELVNRGAKCLLLEAGREFSSQTFPKHELDYSTQLFWGGGLEVSRDGRLGFLRAKCVGGTSIVNQALLDRFDDLAWSDWKTRSGISYFTPEQMEPHYHACEKNLSISEVSTTLYNKNTHLFTKAFNKLEYGWKPLRRAQKDCKIEQGSDCIACLGGCRRDSKQSALITTIRWAREKGLSLESEIEVQSIAYEKDRIKIFGFKKTSSGSEKIEFAAPKVILAAGAIGNSAILLRSGLQNKLPAIGKSFTCHPQFMTYALFDEPIDSHKGAFQAVKSDDQKLRAAGFKLENVFAPPIGTAMLFPGYGRSHTKLMQKYRYWASIEVALRDDPSGEIFLDKTGKVIIQKQLTRADQNKSVSGLKLVRELFESVGSKYTIACQQGFGLHLMGGCAIGSDAKTSVVNPEFQVHEHPGLFIADSSIFPSAPGINPSFTIMALSQKAGGAIK